MAHRYVTVAGCHSMPQHATAGKRSTMSAMGSQMIAVLGNDLTLLAKTVAR